MAFEPFGYRFEIASFETPKEVKAKIRAKKKPWFHVPNAPRGWIVGPFLCLWQSAFNRGGPMVLARIRAGRGGTIITGRAGADLNGTLYSILLFLFLLVVMAAAVIEGQASPVGAFFVIALIGGFQPMILWWSHNDRKDAEGLVRFVERSMQVEPASCSCPKSAENRSTPATASSVRDARPIIAGAVNAAPVDGARLIVDGNTGRFSPSEAGLLEAIAELDDYNFLILEFGTNRYMQAALNGSGFVLEYQDGGLDKHYRANTLIDREGLTAALLHYLHTKQGQPGFEWERVSL